RAVSLPVPPALVTKDSIPPNRGSLLRCGISTRSSSVVGQNPKLPHRNSNGRFTSISGHNEFYLRCRPARLLELRWRCKGLEFRSKRERHREAAWEGGRPQPNANVSTFIKCCR